jgi:DNA-binding IclR family transcriptional regulator
LSKSPLKAKLATAQETSAPRVNAVSNAIAILRSLGQNAPAGVNALARATGVSPSSCFNILKTLVVERLVDFDPVRKMYSPGAGLYALMPQAADGRSAFAKCAPLLHAFADQHQATVALWQMTVSERLVVIGLAECAMTTRIHMTLGQRLPMLAGAAGRSVASAMQISETEIAQRFAPLRWDNPPSLKTYLRQVKEARERGWALDDGAFIAGVTSVSVPIMDRHANPAFVITASLFRGQRREAETTRIGAELKILGARITETLAPERTS